MKVLHNKYFLLVSIIIFLFGCILAIRILYDNSLQKQVAQENLSYSKMSTDIKNKSTVLSSRQIKSIATNDKVGVKSNNDNLKAESQTNNGMIDSTIKEIIPKIENKSEKKAENAIVTDDASQSVSVPPDAVKVELERGKKYRIISYGIGTWNPRPRTKEEQELFSRLTQELVSLHPLGPGSKEKRLKIQAELNIINAETSHPPKIVNMVWYRLPDQKEPPDEEIIEMNLGIVPSPLWFVSK